MRNLLFIAMGGAMGAVLRYLVSTGVYSVAGRNFPYGTLVVNVAGSFVIGLIYMTAIERLSPEWRAILIIGFLGAFTTFSTFSYETFDLIVKGAQTKALMNILLNVMICLVATWVGFVLGRQL
jgi:CrcB protein